MNARDFCPWARQEILAGRTAIVSSLAQLPAAAARDEETYERFGIKSALTMPLATGAGPAIGALSFNTTRAEHEWPAAMVKRLHLVAEVFANALARKHADETLRESEGRLTLATNTAGAGLWVMDPDGSVWASARSFVTAAIAALDPTDNLLHVYSAGHGPILYCDASEGRTLVWDSDNFPLGIFSPMNAGPSRCRPMAPGDMVLLTTDGFFEWEDTEGAQYGIERLRRFLEQHRGATPESIIRGLYEDVRAFAGGTA
jgi:hypothetical protein